MQKEKEEVKQSCESMERDKLRAERQLEDTSTQVHTHTYRQREQYSFLNSAVGLVYFDFFLFFKHWTI